MVKKNTIKMEAKIEECPYMWKCFVHSKREVPYDHIYTVKEVLSVNEKHLMVDVSGSYTLKNLQLRNVQHSENERYFAIKNSELCASEWYMTVKGPYTNNHQDRLFYLQNNEIKELWNEIKALKEKIEELEYAPGGAKYQEAKEHFEEVKADT